MNDSEILKRVEQNIDKPIEAKSLEMLIAEYPLLTYETPALYQIYKNHNEAFLSAEEKTQLDGIILKLRMKQAEIDKRNIAYLERHLTDLSGGVSPPNDE